MFDLYRAVYLEQDWQAYHQVYDKVGQWDDQDQTDEAIKKYYTRKWRTFQMLDHLPLWVELKIDFANDYLAGLKI
ncbi:hypothetical protein ACFL45_05065 [Candidatus Neomarinimicrobiota bacterium]